MNKEQIKELLDKLVEIQAGAGCAPIELSIGGVTAENIVTHDCVKILSAPAVVAEKLQEYGYHLDIERTGVRVYKL